MHADLIAVEKSLDEKNKGFLHQPENTNVDQLFKTAQDMRKSIETKFYLLLGGVGIMSILLFLILILK